MLCSTVVSKHFYSTPHPLYPTNFQYSHSLLKLKFKRFFLFCFSSTKELYIILNRKIYMQWMDLVSLIFISNYLY